MSPIIAACALSIVSAAFVLRVMRRLPFDLFDPREIVTTGLGAAAVSSLATAVVHAVAEPRSPLGDLACVFAGVSLSLVPTIAVARRRAWERGVAQLTTLLSRARRPGRIRILLVQRCATVLAARTPTESEHTALLDACAALRTHGFTEDARLLVDAMTRQSSQSSLSERLVFEAASLAMSRGDLEAADALLEAPVEGTRALRALSHAVQGGADQALLLLATGDYQGEAGVISEVARAHALASMDRSPEARIVFNDIQARHGASALTWAMRPVGPATALALDQLTLKANCDAPDA